MRPHQLLADLARETRRVARAETTTHLHLRDRLLTALVATILVDAIATVGIFLVERHAPQSDITSIGSAAFWTASQLLTVSSSLGNPVSDAARVIDIGLEIYAITVVTAVAGSFAAFFHRRSLERDPLPREGRGGAG
jgi:hypothetical protein